MNPLLTGLLVVAGLALAGDSRQPLRWTPEPISSNEYESSPTFSPDGREMVFMRADRAFARYRLWMSRCEQGRWSAPVAPPFALPPPINEGDPFITPDGQRLYYVSSRHRHDASGGGDLDIWRVARGADGRWGTPQRLPEPVNSGASELLPREDAQGRLIFGSSRAGGFGQSDIYIATPQPGGNWTVANMGPPVSTAANEYEAELSRDGRTLVLVVDRGDRSHLVRFTRDAGGRWVENGRLPGRSDVFQVGPLLSPRGQRLLFSQADGERSGELFLLDLRPAADEDWPPRCGG